MAFSLFAFRPTCAFKIWSRLSRPLAFKPISLPRQRLHRTWFLLHNPNSMLEKNHIRQPFRVLPTAENEHPMHTPLSVSRTARDCAKHFYSHCISTLPQNWNIIFNHLRAHELQICLLIFLRKAFDLADLRTLFYQNVHEIFHAFGLIVYECVRSNIESLQSEIIYIEVEFLLPNPCIPLRMLRWIL